jgi:3-oxoacyl-[acyl-carrier-protein] synthase III
MIGKMLIESLGVYLPARIVSTDEVLRGCRVKLRFPLERVTGIESRRVADEGEFSVELALRAIVDCLSRSKYAPEDIDLIVSCDTSHSTGYLTHSAEPATALKLKHELQMSRALAFDVTNACAGVFTALLIVQALLATGAVRNALVVSGEHITHLVRTAQLEIESFRDPRLACLTLGDAAVALLLEQSPGGDPGFEALRLETLGRHSSLCIGKQTDRSHGGAIMLTDSAMLARVGIEESVTRTLGAIRRNGWFPEGFQHFIMHQTAKVAVEEVIRTFNRKSGCSLMHQRNTINNLKHRGNTATTTHFVALMDHIQNGRISSGERVVFGIAASGVTSGAALYTLDDLPDRVRGTAPVRRTNGWHGHQNGTVVRLPRRIRIESVGTLPEAEIVPRDTVSMLTAVSRDCLNGSRYTAHDVQLMINAGVYRNEFMCEPAIASIVAGNLEPENGRAAEHPGTLAFDLTNGSLGPLEACFVASQMIACGDYRTALVMASEIEVNRELALSRRLGLAETGSALLLDCPVSEGRGGDATGFGTFFFHSDTAHIEKFASHSEVVDGTTTLSFERHPGFEEVCLGCIHESVAEMLRLEGLNCSDIAVVLPPLISPTFVMRLAEVLGFPRQRMVCPAGDWKDLYTSSLAHGWRTLCLGGRPRPGEIGVIVGVGSGIQVGCATYHF